MTDLPDAVKRKLIVNRLAWDLLEHDEYESLEEARKDAGGLYRLHRKDNTFRFERRQQHRLTERYKAVTDQSPGEGITEAEEEIDDMGSSLTMLAPFLL